MSQSKHRLGDSTRQQAGQDQSDDPRLANESGEPDADVPTRGHVADTSTDEGQGEHHHALGADDYQEWESGRQQAL